VQFFAIGTSGTDFAISSVTDTHTFNLPTASATNRGALSSADWTTFNNKTSNVGTVTSVAATAGTGISVSGSPITTSGTLTITNTAPDQVVALTASTGISVSGTYPNFTITNTSPSSGGTVTSVGLSSATSGVTIGSTPITTSGTITLAIATASGSQNGLLSSTDWTTFNGKQNALTNPVTGTGTTNYLAKFTGTSTVGNSALFDGGGFGGFNNTGIASRTFVVNAASGRPLALEAVEFANIHSIYLRPNNSGFNLLTSNYITGGVFLPLSLSGRENNADLVLQTGGNVTIGTTTDSGYKFDVNGLGRFSNPLLLGNFNGEALKFQSSTSIGNTYLRFYNSAGTSRGYLGLFWSGTADYMVYDTGSLQMNLNSSNSFTFTGGGGATFSSTGSFGGASLNGAYLVVKGANGVPASSGTTTTAVFRVSSGTGLYNVLDFGTNESLDYSWIQSTRANSLGTYDYLAIQPNGGNLLIGTTTNSGIKFDVNGTGRFGSNSANGDVIINSNLTALLIRGRTPYEASYMALTWDISPNAGMIIGNSLKFNTNATPGTTAGSTALTLASTGLATFSGNVIIGSGTPNKKLEVITGNGTTNGIRLTYAGGVTTEGMDITYLNTGNTTTSFDSIYNSNSAIMQFRMKTGGTAVTAMTILGSGNIMIATTTDSGDKLRVNGTTFTNDIRTFLPEADSVSTPWRFGTASIASITPNRRLRVNVGGVEYYIGAVEV
jgi:hypothetical protein